jgi:hypothetical protein
MAPPTVRQVYALAAALDLDVDDIGICHACLSFVSLAIESGDERKVAGAITRIAADLWAEGLEQPVRLALRRARERGIPNAEEAIAMVDRAGPRSQVARAIVRRLAADLSARAQGDLLRMGWEAWPPHNRVV